LCDLPSVTELRAHGVLPAVPSLGRGVCVSTWAAILAALSERTLPLSDTWPREL